MKTVESADTREACHKHVVLLGAFLDGVLDAANTLEVDEHLAHCEACRERVELDRAVRGSLKKAMRTVSGGESMRERMLAAVLAEKQRLVEQRAEKLVSRGDAIEGSLGVAGADGTREQAARASQENAAQAERDSMDAVMDAGMNANMDAGMDAGSDTAHTQAEKVAEVHSLRKEAGRLASWRTLVPLASAAAIALVWNGVAQTAPQGAHQTDVMRAGFGHDPLADLVAQHSQPPLPPERTDPKDLRGFERYVGVPVHAPHFRGGARLVGGRVTTIHHERAAMLQYELGQGSAAQRVTVFIYDPQKIQIGKDRLTPRAIGTSEVRVGREDGYSVAVRAGADAGVGYTVVSDLDPERSAELAVFTEED